MPQQVVRSRRREAFTSAVVWLAAFAGLSASCVSPRTQIALRIDTDMTQGPGEALTEVDVAVFWPSDGTTPIHTEQHLLGREALADGGVFRLPHVSTILHPGDNNRAERFRVEVAAVQDGTTLFTVRNIVNFEVQQSWVLDVFLAGSCRFVTCPAGMACGPNGCVSEMVGGLTPWDAASPFDVAAHDATDAVDTPTADLVDTQPDVPVDTGPCGVCTPMATRSCMCNGTERCSASCTWGSCVTNCTGGQVCGGGSCCTPSCPGRCSYDTCTGAVCDSCPSTGRYMSPTNCTMIGSVNTVCNVPSNPTHNECDCPSGLTPCCGGGCC